MRILRVCKCICFCGGIVHKAEPSGAIQSMQYMYVYHVDAAVVFVSRIQDPLHAVLNVNAKLRVASKVEDCVSFYTA
jgi:hypothetical protein